MFIPQKNEMWSRFFLNAKKDPPEICQIKTVKTALVCD